MANTNPQILEEFLVSLGFKIDQAGMKKFSSALFGAQTGAAGVSNALIDAAFAVEKFVARVADGMEKLFFISQRTGASVTNLKAMENAFQNAGFAAGKSTEFIETLAENVRSNPGQAAFIENMFGFDTSMDKAELFDKLLHKLIETAKTGPAGRAVSGQQANWLLGMSDRDFETAIKQMDEIDKRKALSNELIGESGVDMQNLAKDSHEFNENLRLVKTEIGLIADQFATFLLPAVNSVLKAAESVTHEILRGLGGHTAINYNDTNAMYDPATGMPMGGYDVSDPISAEIEATKKGENKYGLVPGFFDSLAQQESSNRSGVTSKKGALGKYQMMPATAAQYGLTPDEALHNDDKAREAAMHYFADLLKQFGGDYEKAGAAYNWGPGHMRDLLKDKDKASHWQDFIPDETRGWLDNVGKNLSKNVEFIKATEKKGDTNTTTNNGGTTVNFNQTVNVQGNDADANGRAVADYTKRTMGNTIRDTKGLAATPGRS